MKDFPARLWRRLGIMAASLGCSSLAAAAETGSASNRTPVLLIHGILDSAVSMHPIRVWLEKRGWQVSTLHLVPNDGSVPLEQLAEQVRHCVDTTFPNHEKIDLVGFSMGGLVCRYYLQRLGGAERVERFVSISAPNHGTCMAFLSNRPGCREMRPGSTFLAELNSDFSPLRQVRYTSIWSPLDLMIIPAWSSQMPVGANIRRWVPAHPLMLFSPGVLRAVADALAAKA